MYAGMIVTSEYERDDLTLSQVESMLYACIDAVFSVMAIALCAVTITSRDYHYARFIAGCVSVSLVTEYVQYAMRDNVNAIAKDYFSGVSLSKAVFRALYAKGIKLDKTLCGLLCELWLAEYKKHLTMLGKVNLTFEAMTDNNPTRYNNPGSCWFNGGCYSYSPGNFRAMSGFVVTGNVGEQPFRALVIPVGSGAVVFNGYMPASIGISADYATSVVAKALGWYAHSGVYSCRTLKNAVYLNRDSVGFMSIEPNAEYDESEITAELQSRLDESTTTCECCGFVTDYDMTYIDNHGFVCNRCLHRHYTQCDNCGEYSHNSDIVETEDGAAYCQSCYPDNVTSCDRCECMYSLNYGDMTEVRAHNSRYTEYVCRSCLESDYIRCDHCDEYAQEYYSETTAEGEVLCEQCAECTGQCATCGERHDLNDLCGSLPEDTRVCQHCYSMPDTE